MLSIRVRIKDGGPNYTVNFIERRISGMFFFSRFAKIRRIGNAVGSNTWIGEFASYSNLERWRKRTIIGYRKVRENELCLLVILS